MPDRMADRLLSCAASTVISNQDDVKRLAMGRPGPLLSGCKQFLYAIPGAFQPIQAQSAGRGSVATIRSNVAGGGVLRHSGVIPVQLM